MSIDLNEILAEENALRDEAKDEALEEYLDNIESSDPDEHAALNKKLADIQYKTTFGLALMQMALLISAALKLDDLAFNKIKKRIIFDARQDDSYIKKMRIICLNYLSDDDELELVSSSISSSEEETEEISNIFKQRVESFKEDYKLTIG